MLSGFLFGAPSQRRAPPPIPAPPRPSFSIESFSSFAANFRSRDFQQHHPILPLPLFFVLLSPFFLFFFCSALRSRIEQRRINDGLTKMKLATLFFLPPLFELVLRKRASIDTFLSSIPCSPVWKCRWNILQANWYDKGTRSVVFVFYTLDRESYFLYLETQWNAGRNWSAWFLVLISCQISSRNIITEKCAPDWISCNYQFCRQFIKIESRNLIKRTCWGFSARWIVNVTSR